MMLGLYRRGMAAFHGFVPGLLAKRAAKGKEDPARFRERLGETDVARPAGGLVWLHGVSVGESVSALPVIERLRAERPDLTVLITTATTTSADILSRRLPDGVIHQYAPVDTPQAVAAFLDHWRPDLAIFIESDIWPNILGDLTARKVPHALISARITEKTFRGWQRFKGTMARLLGGYALIMAQDTASEERLRAMKVTPGPRGNLKTIGAPLPVDAEKLAELTAQTAGRFVFLAASTHYGEDPLIARALQIPLAEGDLLVLAPRHPLRAADIRLDLEAIGFKVAQRSKDEPVAAETQVYLADTLGELGTLFCAANLVIMGGSFLTGIGGHNPLEPARLGKAVITGPDIANWQGIFADLLAADAAFKALGPQDLTFMAQQLRQPPEMIAMANAAALRVSQAEAGTLDTVWTALLPLLPKVAHGD